MRCKTLCLGFFCILFAYYVYTPIPENVEESWKLVLMHAAMKTTSLMATLLENLGLIKYKDLLAIFVKLQLTNPNSDENVTVIDTDFNDIPVRLYIPKRKSERMRPAVIFIHGGGFSLGSCKLSAYDVLNRWTANKLDAVIVGVEYRLAPQYLFPTSLDDSVSVVKFFLQDEILAKYRVDSTRICITGDSSGGTLAAAVTQLHREMLEVSDSFTFHLAALRQIDLSEVENLMMPNDGAIIQEMSFATDLDTKNLRNDPEYKLKIKAQALIYPAVQFLDTFTQREYQHGPLLSRDILSRLVCLYVTEDKALVEAVMQNQHMPEGSQHLFKFVNWSVFLPEKYKKNHVYTEPILGKLNVSYPALVDSRLSPLLVNDSQLQSLPLTYILTCEHDIIRDEGFMYVTRLRNAGVQVTHDHLENGFHGALSFTTAPFNIHLGFIIRDKYINWLEENL